MKKFKLGLALFAALALVFAVGCSSDVDDTDTDTSIIGTYTGNSEAVTTLDTVHKALIEGIISEITAAKLTLSEGDSFSLVVDYIYGTNESATVTITGTWTESDGTISLTYGSLSDTTDTDYSNLTAAYENLINTATITSSNGTLTVTVTVNENSYTLIFE